MQQDYDNTFLENANKVIQVSYTKLPLPKQLEENYYSFYRRKKRRYFVITLLMGFCFYASYNIIDYHLLSQTYLQASILRFGLVLPVCLVAMLVLTRFPSRKNNDETLILIGGITVCLSIVYLMYLSIEHNEYAYTTGMLLFIVYFAVVLQVNFYFSLIVTVLGVTGVITLFAFANVPSEIFLLVSMDHISIAIISLSANYYVQLQHRKTYFRTLLLSESNSRAQLSQDRLEEIVDRDTLTEVGNRRALKKLIEQANAKVKGVLFIDIDYFKKYNDRYGHTEGDECLVTISKIIANSIRETDVCIRYGGEEFIVYLEGAPKERVQIIAESIMSKVRNAKIPHENSPIGFITVSIGIDSTLNGKTLEAMVDDADKALYVAKKAGRDQYAFV